MAEGKVASRFCFSYQDRLQSLERFSGEVFDLLIIGGGITGATTARDAASRGLKVALVEKKDFAWGTSSRSSKLIHGGLRYLENLEFKLVFEALSERAFLLKTASNRVRPLEFYLPVYREDPHGVGILSLGMWLYDFLALFRAPGFHKRLSARALSEKIPSLRADGLAGGFRYFDASMWDDVLTIENLRSAHGLGAAIANYAEAVEPIWQADQIRGYSVRDQWGGREIRIRAHRTILCAGPWTDIVGHGMTPRWKTWLNPSRGVHLVFDSKRLPVPGAVVMSHPQDGRISFVIPRPDLGNGVTIVGTTDGPSDKIPEKVSVTAEDIRYLMELLSRYFPSLKLTPSDIVSAYVGVRPLFKEAEGGSLQKVSREHHIDRGPGGTVVVAGGKYTTARTMAMEIVDFTLKQWREEIRSTGTGYFPNGISSPKTRVPMNPQAMPEAVEQALKAARSKGDELPAVLVSLYGADAVEIVGLSKTFPRLGPSDPEGFPFLEAQLRFAIRNQMVVHLEDFYLRRIPLFLSRADHGLPWLDVLSQVWAQEMGVGTAEARKETHAVQAEIQRRSLFN